MGAKQSQLGDASKLQELAKLQEKGNEVAIHSAHPTEGHISWFPSQKERAYNGIDDALSDLQSFHSLLSGAGIKTKFVRLPYGEHTELLQYLLKLGVPNVKPEQRADKSARGILKGELASSPDPKISQVIAAYKKMTTTLASLGLHLWGGAGKGKPAMATANSWEAEASGNAARVDDVTRTVSKERQGQKEHAGKFEGIVDLTAQDGKTRSLVVLAHDTSQPDVEAVQADIKQMNQYALGKHVRVEYETMSSLYRDVRGEAP